MAVAVRGHDIGFHFLEREVNPSKPGMGFGNRTFHAVNLLFFWPRAMDEKHHAFS
jgi:hypothetical protein